MPYSQDPRPIAVETPVGKDALLLKSFRGIEEISRPFEFQLDLLSERDDVKPDEIVGKQIDFRVDKQDDTPRWFNGFVRRFAFQGTGDRLSMYTAEVVPWFWFLQCNSDCRIFQDVSIKDVIQTVFDDLGFGDFEMNLSGTHPTYEYVVQYRETDFNFVSRLLEQEGACYFFRHEKGKHTMVLADKKSAFQNCDDSEVQLLAPTSIREVTDQLQAWQHGYDFRSGKWVHSDYDFEKPSTDLLTQTNTVLPISAFKKHEHFDFPGLYLEKGDGEAFVKLRMEEEEARYETGGGQSVCRTFSPGYKFKIEKHHASSEEGKGYVLTRVLHRADTGGDYVTGQSRAQFVYENDFQCVPDSIEYRPPRVTPKPLVHGVETAVVTGKSGEEIHTDEYGRVKVQFFWDREGKKDENTTCWIRVATPWSGANWGMVAIPRIGQEVVVSFAHGDPDRPLVTGMLYNKETMPPYGLPDNKTQSGIKTRSTKNGGSDNFNELRFEDKKDEEHVYFHAEKDFERVVENDDSLKVGFDKKDKGDQTIEIFNNQNVTIGDAQASDGSQTVDIWKDRKHTIKTGDDTLKIDQGNREATISMGNDSLTLDMGNQSTELKMGNQETKLGMGNQSTKLDLGKNETEALQSIELKVGQSSIKIDQMGVTIKGMMIKIEGQMMTDVKGMMTTVKGDAMLTAKGGIAMIN